MTATAFDTLNIAAENLAPSRLLTPEQAALLVYADAHPTPRPEPERDRWGRYRLRHPDTGKPVGWTRATTLAKSIADTYNLERWSQARVAQGLAARPDLLATIAGIVDYDDPDAKRLLGRVVDEAKDAGGANIASSLGTAMHTLTEHHDLGSGLTPPEPWAADVAAYAATLDAAGIDRPPEWVERIVLVPDLGVAGTLDRIVTVPGRDLPMIADVKTGRDLGYAWLEIAVQLSLYANAEHMWSPDAGYEPMPVVDRGQALVIHLPVGKAECSLWLVDIARGWEMARLCHTVREVRKVKGLAVTYTPAPPAALAVAAPGPLQDPPLPADRAAWVQQRLAALADNPVAVAHVRANWPGSDGVGHPAAPPWTDQQVDDLAAVLTAAEALVAAPFPTHSDPTLARPPAPPIAVDVPRSKVPDWPTDTDDTAADDATIAALVGTITDLAPEPLRLVQLWTIEGDTDSRPWHVTPGGGPIRNYLIAAAACAWAPHGEPLTRAAIQEIKGAPLEPQWRTGACLGALTADEARLLTQIAVAARDDATVLDDLEAHVA